MPNGWRDADDPARCGSFHKREVRPYSFSRETETVSVRCSLPTGHSGDHSHRGRSWA